MLEDVEEELENVTKVPLGITKKELEIYTYNFTKNLVNIVTAKNTDDVVQFVSNIIKEFNKLEDVKVSLFDFEKAIINKKSDINTYNEFINQMDKDTDKYNVCFIIGIDRFINDIEAGEQRLYQMLKNAEELENCCFIIIDNATKLKSHEYDDWYKEYITGDTGVWVGNGIDDQYLIRTNSSDRNIINNCGSSFGYVINQGEPTMIKLIGIKEETEN